MSMLRYGLPALAAVGSAYAATCSISGTTTIQNAGDASAIGAACQTFTGNIAVATGTTGDLNLNTVQRVKGNINIENAPNVTSFNGDSLSQIDGDWTMNNVQTLSGLSFPRLTSCGSISWTGLPNLANMALTSEIQQLSSLNIQNTFLSDLTGINLKQCDSFYLANNRMLQAFDMQLDNVTGFITLQSNGDRMNVSFPNLQWAENITMRNVPSISMPSLFAVNGSLSFIENDELQSLTLANLTRVDGSLSINSNPQLKTFSIPVLADVVGAVNVENNTVLGAVNFPKLAQVGGAFDAYGNFSKITLPSLTRVRGAFNVQTSEDLGNTCTNFQNEAGPNQVIEGTFQCAGSQTHPGGAGTTPSGTSATTKSSGAAYHNVPAMEITGVMGVLAAMLGML